MMPAYNAECHIRASVLSAVNQSFGDWELIIVDDHSSDSTRDIVCRLSAADARIRLEASEHRLGAGEARNRGMQQASGRFLAFLDSDDCWLPDKLERQIGFMRTRDYAFTFTRYRKVGEDGETLGGEIRMPDRVSYADVLKHCCMATPTVMLDRKHVGDIRMPALSRGEDHVFWLSALKRVPYAYCLQDVLTNVLVRRGSLSSGKLRKACSQWNIYRRVLKLGLFPALWYWLHYITYGLIKYRHPRFSCRSRRSR